MIKRIVGKKNWKEKTGKQLQSKLRASAAPQRAFSARTLSYKVGSTYVGLMFPQVVVVVVEVAVVVVVVGATQPKKSCSSTPSSQPPFLTTSQRLPLPSHNASQLDLSPQQASFVVISGVSEMWGKKGFIIIGRCCCDGDSAVPS